MIVPRLELNDLITGDKFRYLCDIDSEKDLNWINSISHNNDSVLTIFAQTHELVNVIPIIKKMTNKKFVVVSHNSDGSIIPYDGRSFDYHWEPVDNVIHWFCQNCEINTPIITPLPIALENEYIFKTDVKQELMLRINNENRNKDLKVFLCFNIGTNKKSRQSAWDKFSGVNWATCQDGFNNKSLVEPYFNSMSRHKFILCPDGNGVDCIRTWEALYMGCIPIVERHVFTEYFAKYLPLEIVDSWDEITIEWLQNKYEYHDSWVYDYDVLTIGYWEKLIKGKKV